MAYLGDQSLPFFLYLYILIVNCFLKKKHQNGSKQQCILNCISTSSILFRLFKQSRVLLLRSTHFFIVKPSPSSSVIWEFCKHAIYEKQFLEFN